MVQTRKGSTAAKDPDHRPGEWACEPDRARPQRVPKQDHRNTLPAGAEPCIGWSVAPLRRAEERRDENDHPLVDSRGLERERSPAVDGQEGAARDERAKKLRPSTEREERRRKERHPVCDSDAAEQHNREEQHRQGDCFARAAHLRGRNTRSGFRSETSDRSPASSSAFSSSALRIWRSASSTTILPSGASAMASSHARAPAQRALVAEARPHPCQQVYAR